MTFKAEYFKKSLIVIYCFRIIYGNEGHINQKCDIETWYIQMEADGLFKGELTPQQEKIQNTIEKVLLKSIANPRARHVDCSVLNLYEKTLNAFKSVPNHNFDHKHTTVKPQEGVSGNINKYQIKDTGEHLKAKPDSQDKKENGQHFNQMQKSTDKHDLSRAETVAASESNHQDMVQENYHTNQNPSVDFFDESEIDETDLGDDDDDRFYYGADSVNGKDQFNDEPEERKTGKIDVKLSDSDSNEDIDTRVKDKENTTKLNTEKEHSASRIMFGICLLNESSYLDVFNNQITQEKPSIISPVHSQADFVCSASYALSPANCLLHWNQNPKIISDIENSTGSLLEENNDGVINYLPVDDNKDVELNDEKWKSMNEEPNTINSENDNVSENHIDESNIKSNIHHLLSKESEGIDTGESDPWNIDNKIEINDRHKNEKRMLEREERTDKKTDIGTDTLDTKNSQKTDIGIDTLDTKHSQKTDIGTDTLDTKHSQMTDLGSDTLDTKHSQKTDLGTDTLDTKHSQMMDLGTDTLDTKHSQMMDLGTDTLDTKHSQMTTVEELVAVTTKEYASKIQSLELNIVKLENQVLMEKLNKENHSSTISRLENSILKLENDLLKMRQSYQDMKIDNEEMKRKQRKYLELGHSSQSIQYSGLADNSSKHFELITEQQSKIALLSDKLKNQTEIINKMKNRSEYLDDQNRMLYQMVMNQTALMSQIMMNVQSITEQNVKQREETQKLKLELESRITELKVSKKEEVHELDALSNKLLQQLDDLVSDKKIENVENLQNVKNDVKQEEDEVDEQLHHYLNDKIVSPAELEGKWCNRKVTCLYGVVIFITCLPYSSLHFTECGHVSNIQHNVVIPQLENGSTNFKRLGVEFSESDKSNVKNTISSQKEDKSTNFLDTKQKSNKVKQDEDYSSYSVQDSIRTEEERAIKTGTQSGISNMLKDKNSNINIKIHDQKREDIPKNHDLVEQHKVVLEDKVKTHIIKPQDKDENYSGTLSINDGTKSNQLEKHLPVYQKHTQAELLPEKSEPSKEITKTDDKKPESTEAIIGKAKSSEDKITKKSKDSNQQDTIENESLKFKRNPPKYTSTGRSEPKDCYDYFLKGNKRNAVYKIRPHGTKSMVQVFCDMKNGGWTLIQKRQDGTTKFFRDWEEYKNGFGGVYGEHWLGNDMIHRLTNQDHYILRIDMVDWDKSVRYAEYSYFVVDDENEAYKLHISGYSGDAGDAMAKHSGHKFSTRDVDNDKVVKEFGGSCATRFHAAWWFYKCYQSNLNGRYYRGGKIDEKMYDGITWKPWTGPNHSLKQVEMKIKPIASGS